MAETAIYYAYANGGTRYSYRGKVQFNIAQAVENNQFIVDYWFWLYRADGYTGAGHEFRNGNKLVVSINDESLISSNNYKEVILTGTSESNPVLMCSGQKVIAAANDGSKTFNYSFMYDQTQNKGQELDWLTVAGSHTCEPIPRATTPTLSASNAEFGSKVTITTDGAVDTFTHKLTYSIGNTSGTIASDVVDSVSWTIPSDLMKQIPNSTSGVIKITCITYLDGTEIGQKEVNLTAKVPASIVPTLSVAVAEAASIPAGISGYIQSRSRLLVTSTAAGQYGATIKSCTVTVEATPYTGEEITTNTISGSGTIPVKVVVTDSRGRSTTKYVNVTVTAYSLPKLTAVNAYRCAGATDATADKSGAYVCVKPKGSITALGDKNDKTCTVYYKKKTETYYSSKALSMGDYVLDGEYVVIPAAASDSYDIYVVLADSFDSTKYVAPTLMAGAAYIHIPKDRRGMGLGKHLEGKGLEVGWEAKFWEAVTSYGKVYLQNGFNVYTSNAGSGTDGYINMARITISGIYVDFPIVFEIARRKDKGINKIHILFQGIETNDPEIASFTSDAPESVVVLRKSATSTWDLWIKKKEGYDNVAILDLKTNWDYMASRVSITYPGTFSESEPIGTMPELV